MKPILIYTMPRTIGTAALHAAKRDTKLNEPIEMLSIAKLNANQMVLPWATRAKNQHFPDWLSLQNQMSDPNTATKIFGSGLQQFYPARKWFADVAANANTHDLYILLRNPKEILWSLVIALHYGFDVLSERKIGHVEITGLDIHKADVALDNFLRYYPIDGKIVTYKTLPKENFDYSLVNMNEQKSLTKIKSVKNKEYVDRTLDSILQFYQQEWRDKTGTDIFSFGLP